MPACQSCQKTSDASEICPFCFSSQVTVPDNYTQEINQESAELTAAPVFRPEPNSLRLADITYTPGSSWKRWFFRFRGVFSTLLISLFVVTVASYFTVNYFRGEIKQSKKIVFQAIRDSDFEAAAQQWEAIFEKHGRFFDTDGQVEALTNKSDCWQKAGKPEMATSELQRALELKPSENLKEKLSLSHRYLGIYKLHESEAALSDKFYDEAQQNAAEALHFLTINPASPAETARVHRVLSRTYMHYGEFDSAFQHQEAATRAEGQSKLNKRLAKQIKLAKRNSRRRTASITKKRSSDDKVRLEAWKASQPTWAQESYGAPRRKTRRTRKNSSNHKHRKPSLPPNYQNPYVHAPRPHKGFQRTIPPQPRAQDYSAYKKPHFPNSNPRPRAGYANPSPYNRPTVNRPQMPSPRGIPGRPY